MTDYAYRVLNLWDNVVVQNGVEAIDPAELQRVCHELRRLAKRQKLCETYDMLLGGLFGESIHAGDESWPCWPICHVAAEIGTGEFAEGMVYGIVGAFLGGPTVDVFAARRWGNQLRCADDCVRRQYPFVSEVLQAAADWFETQSTRRGQNSRF